MAKDAVSSEAVMLMKSRKIKLFKMQREITRDLDHFFQSLVEQENEK